MNDENRYRGRRQLSTICCSLLSFFELENWIAFYERNQFHVELNFSIDFVAHAFYINWNKALICLKVCLWPNDVLCARSFILWVGDRCNLIRMHNVSLCNVFFFSSSFSLCASVFFLQTSQIDWERVRIRSVCFDRMNELKREGENANTNDM